MRKVSTLIEEIPATYLILYNKEEAIKALGKFLELATDSADAILAKQFLEHLRKET